MKVLCWGVMLVAVVFSFGISVKAGELEDFQDKFEELVAQSQEVLESGKKSKTYKAYIKSFAELENLGKKVDGVVKKSKIKELKKVSLKKVATNYKNYFKKLDTSDSRLIVALQLSINYDLVAFDERIAKLFAIEWNAKEHVKTLEKFSYPDLAVPFTDNTERVRFHLNRFLASKRSLDKDLKQITGFDIVTIPQHDDFAKKKKKFKIGEIHVCNGNCIGDTCNFKRMIAYRKVLLTADGNQKMINQKISSDGTYTCDWVGFTPLKFNVKYKDSLGNMHECNDITQKSHVFCKDAYKLMKGRLDLVKKAVATAKKEFKASNYDAKPLLKDVSYTLKYLKKYNLSSKKDEENNKNFNKCCQSLRSKKKELQL